MERWSRRRRYSFLYGRNAVLWILVAIVFSVFHPGTELPEKLSEWGDFASGVFAPIAFAWLVAAVILQSTELREQRKELALTRREFTDNRKVMKEQAKEAKNHAKFNKQQTTSSETFKNMRMP